MKKELLTSLIIGGNLVLFVTLITTIIVGIKKQRKMNEEVKNFKQLLTPE